MSDKTTLDNFTDKKTNQRVQQQESVFGEPLGDWEVSNLNNSRLFKSTSSGLETFSDSKIYIPTAGVEDGQVVDDDGYITYDSRPSRANLELSIGDVIFAKMKDSIKVLRASKELAEDYVFSTGFIRISPENNVNPEYLKQVLLSSNFNQRKDSLAIGSTQPAIRLSDLSALNIPIPPIHEQRKIATVLYTVDRAVEKTEEIIEQYRRIYAGLLQSEFHGDNEDDTEDAGALGRVPASWSIVPISKVAEVTMGNSPKSEHYNSEGDGLPFYQGANEFGERSPTPDRWCSAAKKVGKPGDTLLNIRSHTNVGKVNKAHHECCIGRGLAAITPGERIDEDYLYHHLRERENYINSIASGSTFDSVNTEEVESVKIALPPMDTQQKIASSLSNIQNGILKQKEIAEKFDRLKRGLMQDLLSGTVRTTDTNIEVPEEITKYG